MLANENEDFFCDAGDGEPMNEGGRHRHSVFWFFFIFFILLSPLFSFGPFCCHRIQIESDDLEPIIPCKRPPWAVT